MTIQGVGQPIQGLTRHQLHYLRLKLLLMTTTMVTTHMLAHHPSSIYLKQPNPVSLLQSHNCKNQLVQEAERGTEMFVVMLWLHFCPVNQDSLIGFDA